MAYLFFWILLAVAVGIYAKNKGRNGVVWFFLSLIISPLLGGIFCAVSKDLTKGSGVGSGPSASTHVKCPACAEFVLPEATVCKHCGGTLIPVSNFAQIQAKKAKASEVEERKNLLIGLIFIISLFVVAGLISKF